MNTLRDIVEQAPRQTESLGNDFPEPLGPSRWNWNDVKRVLIIRLRSIGDTVLATPSLAALKRFLPDAEIDILVEDWVAPVLTEHPSIHRIVSLERTSLTARARVAHEIRNRRYDVVYNFHGGTTATFLTRATGAPHRVGYASYQYSHLHNHQAPSPLLLWGQQKTHSVEQQLALLGWTGVPVTDRPPTQLGITVEARARVNQVLAAAGLTEKKFALMHPAAAFATKQWAASNFGNVVDFLASRDIATVAIAGPNQGNILNELITNANARVVALDLSLPEVTALASLSHLFVGNDSGIAHIAAAVRTPSVVIFGSSNIAHWRPWNTAPAEVVFEEMPCQPCHGYFCEKFPEPECILRVPVERVTAAVERLLTKWPVGMAENYNELHS
jgi:predicted lipopolysaccharide heptosyltransferase III